MAMIDGEENMLGAATVEHSNGTSITAGFDDGLWCCAYSIYRWCWGIYCCNIEWNDDPQYNFLPRV